MIDITTAEREVRSALNATADDPDYAGAWSAFNRILAELDRLRAERDALREDIDRLNWLEKQAREIYGGTQIMLLDAEESNIMPYGHTSLRDAIDAARKGE